MKHIFLFICLLCFGLISFTQEPVRYVYSSTTAEAIDELNGLVPDYEQRKKILIKMRELEDQGIVFLSTNQYKPIQRKIKEVDALLSDTPKDREERAYAEKAKDRYMVITELTER